MASKVELNSRNTEAFFALAKTLHFGRAADILCITPSALSQRIAAIESQLDSKLFHRTTSTVSLTETGERLLRYCQTVEALQNELLNDVGGHSHLGGTITIASFSSVSRSVVMPALQTLQIQHPELTIHYRVTHMHELKEVLLRGQADFVITQDPPDRAGYHIVELGQELNVLVERCDEPRHDDVYLDHDQADDFSEKFLLKHDGVIRKALRRRFCDDIYGILDAARLGFGRGVVPVHLVNGRDQLHLVPGYRKAWATPVLLQYAINDYYPAPFRAVRDALIAHCSALLTQNAGLLEFEIMR